MTAADEIPIPIPKTCKAGVVANEGPDFRVEVEEVPVPEPGRDTTNKIRSATY